MSTLALYTKSLQNSTATLDSTPSSHKNMFSAFITRCFFSTNYKDIGTLYFLFGALASVVGTLLLAQKHFSLFITNNTCATTLTSRLTLPNRVLEGADGLFDCYLDILFFSIVFGRFIIWQLIGIFYPRRTKATRPFWRVEGTVLRAVPSAATALADPVIAEAAADHFNVAAAVGFEAATYNIINSYPEIYYRSFNIATSQGLNSRDASFVAHATAESVCREAWEVVVDCATMSTVPADIVKEATSHVFRKYYEAAVSRGADMGMSAVHAKYASRITEGVAHRAVRVSYRVYDDALLEQLLAPELAPQAAPEAATSSWPDTLPVAMQIIMLVVVVVVTFYSLWCLYEWLTSVPAPSTPTAPEVKPAAVEDKVEAPVNKGDAAVAEQLRLPKLSAEFVKRVVDLHHDLLFFIIVVSLFVIWQLFLMVANQKKW